MGFSFNFNNPTSTGGINNIPNCITTKNNCWHHGNVYLSTLSIGKDDYTLGTDSTGAVWEYHTYGANGTGNNWTQNAAYGQVYMIGVGGANAIWGLSTSTTNGGHYVMRWNGSAWTQTGGGLNQINAGEDNSACGISSINGTLLRNPGNPYNWYSLGAGYRWADCRTTADIVAVKTDGTVWITHSTGSSWLQIPGITNAGQVAIDESDNLLILAVDGTVYYWDGTTLSHLAGTGFVTIGKGGDPNHNWAIGPSSGGANVYRLADQTFSISMTAASIGSCVPMPCPPATHTQTAYIHFAGKSAGAVAGAASGSSQQWVTTTPASDTIYDPFDCLEGVQTATSLKRIAQRA